MQNLYDRICEWLSIHPISTGGCLAVMLTGLRIALNNDKKSFLMVCYEGIACGLLSMSFSYTSIEMFGCNESIGILIGSSAGFIGLDRMKVIFLKLIDTYLNNKVGTNGKE